MGRKIHLELETTLQAKRGERTLTEDLCSRITWALQREGIYLKSGRVKVTVTIEEGVR